MEPIKRKRSVKEVRSSS